ncbi:MAG: ribosome small subunit-dependent GTPase A [Clostridia bacterium]|nr:ribosome small subunit-dependent GTPase A [Clostridia bacterium]
MCGKSTIINAIFDKEVTKEGEISTKNKKGKNTTTDIKLYELDKNTYVADTPGFSSFEITEIESNNLEKYFIDFRKYINECEFVGCTHIKEENCGIKKALEQGKISKERYERFCKIYNELKDKEAHKW